MLDIKAWLWPSCVLSTDPRHWQCHAYAWASLCQQHLLAPVASLHVNRQRLRKNSQSTVAYVASPVKSQRLGARWRCLAARRESAALSLRAGLHDTWPRSSTEPRRGWVPSHLLYNDQTLLAASERHVKQFGSIELLECWNLCIKKKKKVGGEGEGRVCMVWELGWFCYFLQFQTQQPDLQNTSSFSPATGLGVFSRQDTDGWRQIFCLALCLWSHTHAWDKLCLAAQALLKKSIQQLGYLPGHSKSSFYLIWSKSLNLLQTKNVLLPLRYCIYLCF